MAVFSGKNGSIKYDSGGGTYANILDCTGWSFERSIEVKSYASCSTSGFTAKVTGMKSGSGELRGYMDGTNHISTYIDEGDELTVRLFLNATKYHSVPMVITSVSEEVNIEDGDLVAWTANFENNGSWSLFQTAS